MGIPKLLLASQLTGIKFWNELPAEIRVEIHNYVKALQDGKLRQSAVVGPSPEAQAALLNVCYYLRELAGAFLLMAEGSKVNWGQPGSRSHQLFDLPGIQVQQVFPGDRVEIHRVFSVLGPLSGYAEVVYINNTGVPIEILSPLDQKLAREIGHVFDIGRS